MALSSLTPHLQNPMNANNPLTFPQVDVVPVVSSDHWYAKTTPAVTSTSKSLSKAIMKEWKILRNNNLPTSIYVRAYEDRIDLLRAVIVGPTGTPYHDGLFFFDIFFPPNYPESPPRVRYLSFGLRINPNLYASGYVCLSLLNTWSGPKWAGKQSSVLQVLVSLQGLVLNESPFFNEPGTSVYVNTSHQWKEYNDNVFVLSCKTMIFVLRKPPQGFKGFVREHFKERGGRVLTACKAYMHGFVRVGEFRDDGVCLAKKVKVGEQFLTNMNVQYPLLVKALLKKDRGVKELLLDLMIEKVEEEYRERRKKNTVMKKLSGIFSKFLGFNKCRGLITVQKTSTNPG